MLNDIPKLEEKCERCGGRGCYSDGGQRVSCGVCSGSGYEPTAFGERVLELLKHNFRPMLEEVIGPRQ